jgi:hypothetical protein
MIELDKIPAEEKIAKGEYAIVRAAHEDAKKRLAKSCGEVQSAVAQILRRMQPDEETMPVAPNVSNLIEDAYNAIHIILQCCREINNLASQRAQLKAKAWPRGGNRD